MTKDRAALYRSAHEFFEYGGNAVMKLTRPAAKDVCREAAGRGLVVERVEGGIWHSPGFEARVDCIWDGIDLPVDKPTATQNNLEAEQFILGDCPDCDTFILTLAPMAGWPPQKKT